MTVGNILAPHRERTLRRMQAHDTVLCIQDGTRLNFTRRGRTQGLGAIGSNQTGAVARGLELHTTLAVNPDGVALGRAAGRLRRARRPEAQGQPTAKPREERKSFRWIEGLRDCAQAAAQLSQTRVVCTMDREADFLDLFVERRAHAPQVDLLVRAKADRVLGKEQTPDGQTVSRRLFDEVRNAPARGAAKVEVQRLSARVKASKQARKDRRAARVADVTLRYQQVALPCPRRAGRAVGRPCARGTAAARGRAAGVVPADHLAGDQHRRRHADPAMVRPALAHRRVLPGPQVRLQGRRVAAPHGRAARTGHGHQDGHRVADPVDGPARARGARAAGRLLFSDGELRVLATFARSRALPPPVRLSDAVGLTARLGGWLGRSRDPPGAQLLWHGYTQLVAMAFAFELRDEFG